MEHVANELLRILESNGFASYKVGGYVRDKLLGLPVKDIDIATAATPDQVTELFPHSIPTGIKHGTVTIPFEGFLFEVTTFRVDKEYKNHRHPSQVEFVSNIEEDLGRRDFTINAMAMDQQGQIIDPFNGKQDLKRGLIRTVRNPYQRLEEDALRILRAIRFSSRFNFSIDPDTWKAMLACGKSLAYISQERIRDEWRKTIESNGPLEGINLLSRHGILPFEEWRNLFAACNASPNRQLLLESEEPSYRWAVILALGHPKNSASLLSKWKFPKALIREVQGYLDLIFTPFSSDIEIKRQLLVHGVKKVQRALHIKPMLDMDSLVPTEECLIEWDQEFPIRQLKDLAIQGNDLIHGMQRPAGPWVGKTLEQLYELVVFHALPNERNHLLDEARKVIHNEK